MRRLLLAAGVVAVALAGTGCRAQEESPAAAVSWIAEQDHVADARQMPYDDGDGAFVRVTLDPDLTDAQVDRVAHGLKAHFDDATDRPSLELDVDGFQGDVHPGLVGADGDLQRALWLRRDGRATSFGEEYHSRVSTHPLVIAPAADVGALALDYDAAVPHAGEVRRSHSVESADGTTGVQWAVADGLGFGLPTDAVTAFAAVQRRFPGTTGWVDSYGGPATGAVHLDPTEVDLDRLLRHPRSYVDPTAYRQLELGWGPGRAPYDEFATTFGPPEERRILRRLAEIPGVTAYSPPAVTVSDRASYLAVRALERTLPTGFRIDLLRAPVLYGDPERPVLTSVDARGAEEHVYRTVAGLDQVDAVDLSRGYYRGTASVEPDITDTQLRALLTALAALPGWYEQTAVLVRLPDEYAATQDRPLLTLTRDGVVDPARPVAAQDPLRRRIAAAWDTIRTSAG